MSRFFLFLFCFFGFFLDFFACDFGNDYYYYPQAGWKYSHDVDEHKKDQCVDNSDIFWGVESALNMYGLNGLLDIFDDQRDFKQQKNNLLSKHNKHYIKEIDFNLDDNTISNSGKFWFVDDNIDKMNVLNLVIQKWDDNKMPNINSEKFIGKFGLEYQITIRKFIPNIGYEPMLSDETKIFYQNKKIIFGREITKNPVNYLVVIVGINFGRVTLVTMYPAN